MKSEIIKHVKDSWAQIMPRSQAAANLFYDKLFELDPELKPLFRSDLNEQGKKFMLTLSIAVSSLSNFPEYIPAIREMGKRHASYGVQDKDYDTVGEALIWALQSGLKEAFTEEVKAAWQEVYRVVADTMKAGAR